MVDLTVRRENQAALVSAWQQRSLDLRQSWKFQFEVTPGTYEVDIHVEGELAYRAKLTFEVSPF